LVAIASRSIEKARAFAEANDVGANVTLYGNYDDLLKNDTIQAVYVPLPTKTHIEWAVKVANAGKHVLLEKPAALTSAELEVIINACNANKVLFMDGVMFMHHDRLDILRVALSDPLVGPVSEL
jgi:predicted dehydrogenase